MTATIASSTTARSRRRPCLIGGVLDCATVPVTDAAGVPAGHLVGLDSEATEPTSSSASVTIPSDGTVIEGDLLLLGAAIPTGTGSLVVSSRRGDIFEDFEDADLSVDVTGTWLRTNSEAHTGAWCFTSAPIGDNQSSEAVVSVPAGAKTVQFWYRVSTEPGFDFFFFFIDDALAGFASGEGAWANSGAFDVSEAQTVTFRYTKDSSLSAGSDAVFLDDLQFTGAGDVGAWSSLGTAVRSGHTSQMWWRLAETADLGATVTVTPSVGAVRQVLLLGKVSEVDQDQPIIGGRQRHHLVHRSGHHHPDGAGCARRLPRSVGGVGQPRRLRTEHLVVDGSGRADQPSRGVHHR